MPLSEVQRKASLLDSVRSRLNPITSEPSAETPVVRNRAVGGDRRGLSMWLVGEPPETHEHRRATPHVRTLLSAHLPRPELPRHPARLPAPTLAVHARPRDPLPPPDVLLGAVPRLGARAQFTEVAAGVVERGQLVHARREVVGHRPHEEPEERPRAPRPRPGEGQVPRWERVAPDAASRLDRPGQLDVVPRAVVGVVVVEVASLRPLHGRAFESTHSTLASSARTGAARITSRTSKAASRASGVIARPPSGASPRARASGRPRRPPSMPSSSSPPSCRRAPRPC